MTVVLVVLAVAAVISVVRLARPATLLVVIRCHDAARQAAERVAGEVRNLGHGVRVEIDEDVLDLADDDGSPVTLLELTAPGRLSTFTVEQRVVDDVRMSQFWRRGVAAWCRGARG